MSSKKQPPGGHDATPVTPTSGDTYTVKITFHRAHHVPIADFGKRSADPFILAQVNTSVPTRHEHDPHLRYRSQTIHRTLEPEWNAEWIIAGVPRSGLTLKARLYDEDPDDYDDSLGEVEVETGAINEHFAIKEETYKVRKTGANFKAYALRSCLRLVDKAHDLHARLVLSVEVLGKTKEEVGKVYTVNNFWWIHYSPMIGRIAGTKTNDEQGVEKFNFQANEIQLQGPVPNEMYHRYVEFKGFVGGMFQGSGFRGKLLNKALHHQHERIYNFNPQTKYGVLEGPGREMTLKFLDMVHYDQGGRIFTYVITLDGMFRFTETGKEFGIDLLSKHTMHSDVNIYIAWSGEFLVRRLAHPNKSAEDPDQRTHPAEDVPGGPPNEAPPKDPRFYELVIDNDSGTYRPDKQFLPLLHEFMQRNLVGLQVLTKACDDDELAKIKEEQKKVKTKEGDHRVYGQASDAGSISSSEADDLEDRAREDGEAAAPSKVEKTVEVLGNPKEAVKKVIPGEQSEREHAEEREDTL